MAVFKLDPDRASVEELIEDLSRELASRYRDVEDELIREVAKRAQRDFHLAAQISGNPADLSLRERRAQNVALARLASQRAESVRELQARAVQLVDRLRSEDLARQILELAATEGEQAAAARLGLARGVPPLTGTASQAVAAVVFSLESRLEVLNQRLTRYPQDAYQRIVSLHSPGTLLGESTARVQQARTVQRFLAEGITGFVDRGGRNWTVGAYAEMAGRTTVNRAFTDAGIWRMQQSGVHLVTVVRGLDSCSSCAAWAGSVLSTDGTPAGPLILPHATQQGGVAVQVAGTVADARNAGWGHPNCRCRLVAYVPGLSIPQGDTTYDEEAEKERARQRLLERRVRGAKRREVSSMTDTDRATARADVREARADLRDFTRKTGRRRDSYREQLGFSGT